MVEDRLLELYQGSIDDFGVLCPTSGLAAVGDADPGINWHCPACDALLAQAVYPGQFLDVLLQCFSCSAVGASPRRESGEPLAGRPVLLPPGQYRLDSVLDLVGKPVMLVGRQALDGYLAETSAASLPSSSPAPLEIGAAFLRDLIARAINLLGDRYTRLRASDERGQSSPTPPLRRHRLIELICYAEEVASALERRQFDEPVELDGNKLSELYTIISLFERWRNHPAWSQLVASLANDAEVQHSLTLLAVASYLRDSGNGVGLVFEGTSGRISDLWIVPSLVERIDIEVKAPVVLRGPRRSALSPEEAEDVLTRQVNKAASARRGQLDPDSSGLLVIGTFHLAPEEVEELSSTAGRILEGQRSRKPHLAGVVISAFSYTIGTVANAEGLSRIEFASSLQTLVVRHPGYQGNLSIEEGLPPWRTTSLS
jgi:hypothetical protein